jgi:hypothetical protein
MATVTRVGVRGDPTPPRLPLSDVIDAMPRVGSIGMDGPGDLESGGGSGSGWLRGGRGSASVAPSDWGFGGGGASGPRGSRAIVDSSTIEGAEGTQLVRLDGPGPGEGDGEGGGTTDVGLPVLGPDEEDGRLLELRGADGLGSPEVSRTESQCL